MSIWIFYVLMTVDIIFTMLNLHVYVKYHPEDKEWYSMERNPIISYSFKKLGLWKGTIIASVFTYGLLTIFLYIFSFDINMYYYLYGMYTLLIYLHIVVLVTLVKQKDKFKRKF